jgi:predicted TIM-barrel fold metal-dependent hydrolase
VIIDFHTHAFSPHVCSARENFLDDENFRGLYGNPAARMLDAPGLAGAMKEGGVDRAVVMGFPWTDSRRCMEQNEYFAGVAAGFRDILYPFASVPMDTGENIDSMVSDIKAMGLYGVGELGFYRNGFDSSAAGYLRHILEAAGKHSLPVCLHVNEPVGHSYPGKYDPGLSELYDVIKDHPANVIILAHWGGGLLFYELMPEVKKSLKNVYYDSAATPFLYEAGIYREALSIAGAGKILFGTDHPLLPFKRCIDQVVDSVRDEKNRDLILGGNAARILDI